MGVQNVALTLGAKGAFLATPSRSNLMPTPAVAAVDTTAFEERKDGSVRIEQTIYVQRESQKPIVLGKNGQTLKWIGQKAREELKELFDREVHLFLHVKVDETWADKREFYGDVGLDFDA